MTSGVEESHGHVEEKACSWFICLINFEVAVLVCAGLDRGAVKASIHS